MSKHKQESHIKQLNSWITLLVFKYKLKFGNNPNGSPLDQELGSGLFLMLSWVETNLQKLDQPLRKFNAWLSFYSLHQAEGATKPVQGDLTNDGAQIRSTQTLLEQFRGRKGELKTNQTHKPGAVGSFSDTNKRAHWTETWRVTFKGWSQQWCHSSSWSDRQNTNGQTLILSSVLTPTDTESESESSRGGTDSPGCLVSMSAPRWTSHN